MGSPAGRGGVPSPPHQTVVIFCIFSAFYCFLSEKTRKNLLQTAAKAEKKQRFLACSTRSHGSKLPASCQQVTVPEPPGQKEKRLNLKEESLVFVLYLSFSGMLRCTQSCRWRSESVVRCRRER